MARLPVLKGTLDLLVLRALSWTPMHGFEIVTWLERAARVARARGLGALPGGLPPRGARPAPRRMGRHREQPPRALLQAHRRRPRLPARRNQELDAVRRHRHRDPHRRQRRRAVATARDSRRHSPRPSSRASPARPLGARRRGRDHAAPRAARRAAHRARRDARRRASRGGPSFRSPRRIPSAAARRRAPPRAAHAPHRVPRRSAAGHRVRGADAGPPEGMDRGHRDHPRPRHRRDDGGVQRRQQPVVARGPVSGPESRDDRGAAANGPGTNTGMRVSITLATRVVNAWRAGTHGSTRSSRTEARPALRTSGEPASIEATWILPSFAVSPANDHSSDGCIQGRK